MAQSACEVMVQRPGYFQMVATTTLSHGVCARLPNRRPIRSSRKDCGRSTLNTGGTPRGNESADTLCCTVMLHRAATGGGKAPDGPCENVSEKANYVVRANIGQNQRVRGSEACSRGYGQGHRAGMNRQQLTREPDRDELMQDGRRSAGTRRVSRCWHADRERQADSTRGIDVDISERGRTSSGRLGGADVAIDRNNRAMQRMAQAGVMS